MSDARRAPAQKLEATADTGVDDRGGRWTPKRVGPWVRHPQAGQEIQLAGRHHRALVANEHLYQWFWRRWGKRDIASRSDSPTASLGHSAGGPALDETAAGDSV